MKVKEFKYDNNLLSNDPYTKRHRHTHTYTESDTHTYADTNAYIHTETHSDSFLFPISPQER